MFPWAVPCLCSICTNTRTTGLWRRGSEMRGCFSAERELGRGKLARRFSFQRLNVKALLFSSRTEIFTALDYGFDCEG